MLAQPLTQSLHLPSLTIEGFRGIKSLSIPRLGQVTLLSGKNAVGKTTVLEAVQLYATRGYPEVIRNILRDRNELILLIDEYGDEISVLDVESLFYRRLLSSDSYISIGIPEDEESQLSIKIDASPQENQRNGFDDDYSDDAQEMVLHVEFRGGTVREVPLHSLQQPYVPRSSEIIRTLARVSNGNSHITCEFLGPSALDNRVIDRMWNKVALTDNETSAIKALRLVYGNEIRAIAIVGGTGSNIGLSNRYPIVKIDGHARPVPLRSLGDGATRIFSVALALANSQGGFLVIDEAENGIHHSVQRDFWHMVIRTAQENDVQVIATTHSWDCVVGFGEALRSIEDEAGLLVHLSRYDDSIRATEYSGEDLQTAIRHGTEVR